MEFNIVKLVLLKLNKNYEQMIFSVLNLILFRRGVLLIKWYA